MVDQAQLQTKIRYGPEESALQQLLGETKASHRQGVRNEGAAAAGIQAAAKAAGSQVKNTYREAAGEQAAATGDLKRDLSGLSPAADAFKAAAGKERAGAASRLSRSSAGAQSELANRQVDAEAGRQFAVRSLTAKHSDEVKKVSQRREQLAGEAGAFTLATLQDLHKAKGDADDADRKFDLQVKKLNSDNRNSQQRIDATLRGQSLSHKDRQESNKVARQNADTAERRASTQAKGGGSGGGKGKSKFTPVQLRSARAQWSKGSLFARQYKKAGALNRKNGDAIVSRLVSKGVDEPIARGVVQTHLFGGVRGDQRRKLQSNYGLKPKVISRGGSRRPSGPLAPKQLKRTANQLFG